MRILLLVALLASLLFSAPKWQRIVQNTDLVQTSGLVAFYQCENNVLDSQKTFNGISNTVTYSTGKSGQGCLFSGNSIIEFPSNPIPSIGAFTVSFFVKTSAHNVCIMSFGDFWLKAEYLTGQFSLGDLNPDYKSLSRIDNSVWNHCVLTVDSANNISIYINGVLEFNGNKAISRTNGGLTIVGVARSSYPVYYFSGSLDQVRIYSRALSASEVQALYQVGN